LGELSFAVPPTQRKLVLPGSFNPLHVGHTEMIDAASKHLQSQGKSLDWLGFELSAFNVDKAPLAKDNLLNRMAQFAGQWNIVASNAPTFIEKARLLKNTTFVVGFVRFFFVPIELKL